MHKKRELYEVNYKLSSSNIFEGTDEQVVRTKASMFTVEVATRLTSYLQTTLLTNYVTDVIETGQEYSFGIKDFEAHYILEGVHLLHATSSEEATEKFNDFIDNRLNELEETVFYAGVYDSSGYVTSTKLKATILTS